VALHMEKFPRFSSSVYVITKARSRMPIRLPLTITATFQWPSSRSTTNCQHRTSPHDLSRLTKLSLSQTFSSSILSEFMCWPCYLEELDLHRMIDRSSSVSLSNRCNTRSSYHMLLESSDFAHMWLWPMSCHLSLSDNLDTPAGTV